MKILVACEFSGVVRDSFRARGHDAWSCDILPSETDPEHHLQCEVEYLLDEGWDLMIAHPPCTYLCSSGLHWNKKRPERAQQTEDALAFIRVLMGAPIERIAIENPIGCISTRIRPPEQIIQPWMFGEDASKATCLWLQNLPLLTPTNIIAGRPGKNGRKVWGNQTPSGQNKLGPSPDRWRERSRTYPGIAWAMAAQWG